MPVCLVFKLKVRTQQTDGQTDRQTGNTQNAAHNL